MKLFSKTTGKELTFGQIVHDFRDDAHILISGTPPHKPSSTGFVVLRSMCDKRFEHEYYASVIDAEWV